MIPIISNHLHLHHQIQSKTIKKRQRYSVEFKQKILHMLKTHTQTEVQALVNIDRRIIGTWAKEANKNKIENCVEARTTFKMRLVFISHGKLLSRVTKMEFIFLTANWIFTLTKKSRDILSDFSGLLFFRNSRLNLNKNHVIN